MRQYKKKEFVHVLTYDKAALNRRPFTSLSFLFLLKLLKKKKTPAWHVTEKLKWNVKLTAQLQRYL